MMLGAFSNVNRNLYIRNLECTLKFQGLDEECTTCVLGEGGGASREGLRWEELTGRAFG